MNCDFSRPTGIAGRRLLHPVAMDAPSIGEPVHDGLRSLLFDTGSLISLPARPDFSRELRLLLKKLSSGIDFLPGGTV